ncbi:MAG: hypothetical protein ACTMIR_13070 [Cellulomonadaceae bacterium]
MSRTDSSTMSARTVTVVSTAVLVVVASGWLLLRERAPGNMGNGFLTAGLVAYALYLVAVWRARRRPANLTSAERSLTRTGDERDDAVTTRALAVVGLVALPLVGAASIAIALGAHTPMVLALLLWSLLISQIVSFVVVDRRS